MNKHYQPDESTANQPAADTAPDSIERKRDQEALRQSEEKYRRLFETMDTGFAVGEAIRDKTGKMVNYRLIELNPAFEKLTGLNANEAVGKTILEVLPGLDSWWLDTYQQVVDSRETVHVEEFLPQLNRWYDVTAFHYGQEQFAVYYNDITERKRHEANLAFLAEVVQDLAGLTNIEATMNQLGAKLGQHFNASLCVFSVIDMVAGTFTNPHVWYRAGAVSVAGAATHIADYYTDDYERASRSGQTWVVRDAATDQRAKVADMMAIGIAAVIHVPLLRDGEWRFSLSITDAEPRDWREDEIDLLSELTTRIWTRLEGARAEEALRDSEEKFRLLGIASSDSIYRMSPDWTQMHQLMGKSFLADTINPNSSWLEAYIPPEDQPQVQQVIREAIRTKTAFELEHRVRRAEGTVGWTFSRAIPVLDEQGAIREWLGAASDITARKRAEEALQANEERFRTLIQNLPDYAIFRIDPQGIITEWTEGAQRVKGYTAQEVIGQSIALFYTPEGLAAGELTTEMAQAAQAGRAERESVRIRKGGERFWVNEIMTAIHDGAGQLMGFTKISRDITERKVAERTIRDSQQRLQIVLDSIADHAIITTDPQSRITGWNPGAQQLFGYAAGEATGQSLAIIFTPEDRAVGELEAELALAREQGRAPDERYHLRKDGSQLYVSGVLSPLYEADGELVGYVKVARDLTERRRMEQALREADERKDEFLAMLAHELRNPLAPIRNGLQILSLTEGTTPDLAPLVALMSRQLTHLVRLVDDLLDVSRISQGKIELKRERLELGSLVGGVVEAARPLYQTRGKTLELALPTMPLFIDGDATRLAQVVTNLLTNGNRYTGEDGRVRVTLEWVQGEARLRVADNGIGLETGQLDAIFELFVQVDNSVARSQGGLGLGLTLVKRLIELHGGRIEVRSAGLGQGSEFSVYLPLLRAENPPLTIVESTPQPTGQPPLLIIDDNADAALTLAMLLKLQGYRVHTRSSGRAGLEAAEQLRPAAILLDIGMPDLDGYETCRLLRQQPWGKAVPVIALTGYGQAEDQRRTREAGFNEHLVKPVDLAALTDLLTRLLVG